ncbi:glycosyltransferase family 8 protein [Lentithecium fluviatile CBS 122367]|uniref:glycogenin glucosyltransferase n=1 Tax=Lentithecium fluviatile CBS 122367 TaxID=1168545 RepID=A0A6G1J7L1_9PLEO|nr:glycosyltransferase family 8 protein [Lentithecium fluviatile CBS 122367]
MARPLEDVYCTLLMSDSYLPGAAVLAHSLRDAGTTKKLAALVTLDTLSADTITELRALYDYLIPVERIRNPNPGNLYLMGRPDLLYAFTKIALWRQTRFRKIVYLDADVVALKNLDELFAIEPPFAAAPDIGWPDAFNTGVMVLTPNMGEFWALQTMAAAGDSFDGADQGLLNQYYENRNWHRLNFTYNCTPNAQYQWEPAYRYHKRDIRAVHFIGKDKPWSTGRKGPSGSGVYNELLARWWAVYDRHLKQAAAPSTAQQGSATERRSSVIQGYVHGETTSADFGTTSTQHITPVPEIVVEPEAPATSTEMPLSEPGEVSENIDQGVIEPTPTVEQRKFSAPQTAWDATRSEPPVDAVPEAANFPTETYEFSASHILFKPPQSYPAPPEGMWYNVPEEKPKPAEKPKPIFPWEREADRPKATRVFAEDFPPSPPPAPAAPAEPAEPALPSPTHPFSTVHYEAERSSSTGRVASPGLGSPERASSPKTADEQWQEFQSSNVNAWDSVPGIDTYVRAIMESQTRRGKTQVIHDGDAPDAILSPALGRKNRRESLILTDFPTAVERPSLPVTPAPVARPTFWGEERDMQGELPQAEGVPDQAQWVCPQCGFSSVSESDFRRPSRKATSPIITTATTTSPSATIVEVVADSPKTQTEPPQEAELPERTPSPPPPPASPPKPDPRSGVSPRGAPLASLTNPSLLADHTHFPGFIAPFAPAPASNLPSPVASSP